MATFPDAVLSALDGHLNGYVDRPEVVLVHQVGGNR
jgi:hypothetical protein